MKVLGPNVRPHDMRSAKPLPKVADPFYLSSAWRELVERLKVERFGSVENVRCEDPVCRAPWRRGRVAGDHIVELKDGGAPLDPRNVMFRCPSCHTRKTNAARASRMLQG